VRATEKLRCSFSSGSRLQKEKKHWKCLGGAKWSISQWGSGTGGVARVTVPPVGPRKREQAGIEDKNVVAERKG